MRARELGFVLGLAESKAVSTTGVGTLSILLGVVGLDGRELA